jgi:hypothetical protein
MDPVENREPELDWPKPEFPNPEFPNPEFPNPEFPNPALLERLLPPKLLDPNPEPKLPVFKLPPVLPNWATAGVEAQARPKRAGSIRRIAGLLWPGWPGLHEFRRNSAD